MLRASQRLGVPFGMVDLSLAPILLLSAIPLLIFLKKSVLSSAEVPEQLLAWLCLMMLLKRRRYGFVKRWRSVSAFIPVSEDAGMIDAAKRFSYYRKAWKL